MNNNKALSILIIDDSATSRAYVLKNLNMTDLTFEKTYEAKDGDQGLKIIREQALDILFLDINLPTISGVQVAEAMQAEGFMNKVHVVIISSDGSQERHTYLQKLGVKRILRKPFSPELFQNLIQELYHQKAA